MSEVNTITAQRGHVQAMAFARKGGAALGSLLFSIAKRKEEESKGPIETMLFLQTHFSDEEMSMVPKVGSKKGDTGNKPYDKYTIEVTTADGKRNVPGSWYTDVVKSTDDWAALNLRREQCKVGQGEDIPADILAMSTGQRAMEKKRIDAFISNMRKGLTKGAMLLHHVEEVNAMNPARVKVRMPYMNQKDKDGNAVTVVTGSLIRVSDPSGIVEEEEVLTVSQFLAWNVEKASKADDKGSITSLKATATRAPKGTGAGKGAAGKTAYVAPATLEQVLLLFNVLATGIDQESDEGEKLYSRILTKVSAKDKDADEAVVSIGKVCLACDALWTIVRPRYMLIQEQKAKAAATSAAA